MFCHLGAQIYNVTSSSRFQQSTSCRISTTLLQLVHAAAAWQRSSEASEKATCREERNKLIHKHKLIFGWIRQQLKWLRCQSVNQLHSQSCTATDSVSWLILGKESLQPRIHALIDFDVPAKQDRLYSCHHQSCLARPHQMYMVQTRCSLLNWKLHKNNVDSHALLEQLGLCAKHDIYKKNICARMKCQSCQFLLTV